MSHLILFTIIQTVKNIILWSQMVIKLTVTIAFSIKFGLYKPIKMPLNQRFSHNLAGRAPP
ncbi:hypothetical protein BAQ44_26155 [Bacillus mobilis]|nr:hypothetical protein BAQ44_26155 [Bacillus mobilis]